MSLSLKRIIRLRKLREDVMRMTLESESAGLGRLESEIVLAADQARQSRERSFAGLERSGEGNGELRAGDWRLEQANWAQAIRRRERAEAGRPTQQARVDLAMERYLSQRQERRQVEVLQEAAEVQQKIERGRREQRVLDDWFQSRSAAGSRLAGLAGRLGGGRKMRSKDQE